MTHEHRKGSATAGLLSWIAGGAVSLVATIALAFATSTSSSVDALSVKESTDNTAIVQRVSITEAHYQDIDARLTRIENKLDKLAQ